MYYKRIKEAIHKNSFVSDKKDILSEMIDDHH